MQIIGHKGACATSTENTLPSFREALEHRVYCIEFDVRNTADGHTVVFHDASLLRMAGDLRRISDCTLSELREVKIGNNETIPTLNEALDVIGDNAKVNIEIKDAKSTPNVCQVILQRVKSGRNYDDFIVSAFRPQTLRDVHKTNAKIRLALLQVLPFGFLTTRLPIAAVGFSRFFLPKFLIKIAKSKGLWVYAWTVNSQRRASALAKNGVDAVVTDHADLML